MYELFPSVTEIATKRDKYSPSLLRHAAERHRFIGILFMCSDLNLSFLLTQTTPVMRHAAVMLAMIYYVAVELPLAGLHLVSMPGKAWLGPCAKTYIPCDCMPRVYINFWRKKPTAPVSRFVLVLGLFVRAS
ncbi:hypothetical protein V1519DRAFT_451613 [Lipomyces tetrasporus]